ncbi:hypothetical protein [Sinimarinibacterium sp. CAU 1509]|uniref:hypothetical protein n=1 Tax=Sinimarinibacterium sp. CAU 1509 TaxID=2562283 RepID=UPI001B7FC7A0|nr:hypothetical protein [Sinimarinibacterium sp. CAU 1509]
MSACRQPAPAPQDDGGVNLTVRPVANTIANIPPQCFTRTQDAGSKAVQNPCYVCHAEAPEPNYQSQPELQLAYAFPQVHAGSTTHNDWSNLFIDRGRQIAAITDDDTLSYVRGDNYRNQAGAIELTERLKNVPAHWDVNGNGSWDGYVPDAQFRFDAQGYDRTAGGKMTGWRAFVYYPFPGAFMPTNGAFDDVLIRLPEVFRQDRDGKPSETVYTTNLAIVESLITRRNTPITATDETALGVDLDKDGVLGTATQVTFDWAPLEKRYMHYVGQASTAQDAGQVHLAAGLFPEGTEFLHSVRYLDLDATGVVVAAPRMKELRYSRKRRWLTYSDLYSQSLKDIKEADLNPDRPEQYLGDPERGLISPLGWAYQGYIEDARGRLRPQTQEESQFCVGCHSGLSATEDGAFAFPRKINRGNNHGWEYWGSRPFRQLPDPLRTDGQTEFRSYLLANQAGDEFRANAEVRQRFFDENGAPRAAAFATLATDLESLMLPSPERALLLNKAYWLVVREQSFAKGRDPVISPSDNVLRDVDMDQPTGIVTPLPAPRLGAP